MFCLEVIQQMNEKAHQEYLAKEADRAGKIDKFIEALTTPEVEVTIDKLYLRLCNEAVQWPCEEAAL